MRSLLERWQYYISGIFLTSISLVILFVWDVSFFNLLLGTSIFGVGTGLCFLGSRQRKKQNETSLLEDKYTPDAKGRAIYTEGGNYTESIQGDCITIQGNQIYINRDLSQLTEQIQEVLSQLQTLGYTHELAEKIVANELKTYAHSNARVRETLTHWRRSLESSREQPFNVTEAVERVAKIASENLLSSVYDPILVIKGHYKKLFDLLREGRWEEADEETTKIIFDLMPEQNYRYLAIDQIPPKDLKKIDQLWVKCSDGRFGFSVQQSIWKKILKVYDHSEYWVDEEAYLAFIDCVGWAREDDRIYHTDFKYSLKAPRGHLPVTLMLDLCGYDYPSNYTHLNASVFNDLMQREYYKTASIPSWLKQRLMLE